MALTASQWTDIGLIVLILLLFASALWVIIYNPRRKAKRGRRGDTGASGAAGAAGSTGATGAAGATGSQMNDTTSIVFSMGPVGDAGVTIAMGVDAAVALGHGCLNGVGTTIGIPSVGQRALELIAVTVPFTGELGELAISTRFTAVGVDEELNAGIWLASATGPSFAITPLQITSPTVPVGTDGEFYVADLINRVAVIQGDRIALVAQATVDGGGAIQLLRLSGSTRLFHT